MSELYNFVTVKTRGMKRLINLRNVTGIEPQGDSCIVKLVGGELITLDYSLEVFTAKLKDGSLTLIVPPSINDVLGTRGL